MKNRISRYMPEKKQPDPEAVERVQRMLDKIWEDYDPDNPMLILYPVDLGPDMAALLSHEAQKRFQRLVVLFVREE